ncbi:MAG: hypothetical protein PHU77_00040 [Simplicispira sp.]|nr:hypothetical protein [Simplicispira sp.]
MLAKENADTLSFASEVKTLSGDTVTTSNVPANGVVWDVYVMVDEANKVIAQVDFTVAGSVITIAPDTPEQFSGKKLHYKYAYGTVSQQMDAALQAHATAPDPHPQYKATLDAPLSFTYTGTLAAAPTAYQTAPMVPAPSGKEWVGWVSMAQIGPGVSGITFPNLEGVGSSFYPYSMDALTNLSLPALTTVGGTFNPGSLPALTTLSLPALTTVGAAFSPYSLAALTNLSLPALTTVGSSFSPNSMAALTSLSLPALTTVGGVFGPYNMAALTTLSVPALTTVVSSFGPNTMAALTTLSLPALTTVGSSFNPNSMAALTSLSVPALTTVGSSFSPNTMAALTTLSLPALTTVGSSFNPKSMAALTSLSLPAIERIGTSLASGDVINISNDVGALTSFILPATLKQVGGTGGNVTITSAKLNQASVDSILIRLAALDGTNGTTAFNNRTVTITGMSSPPSADGLAAKAVLIARGCTVTHK